MKRFLLLLCLLSGLAFGKLRGDINGDCRVDIADLAILMSDWLFQENCDMGLGDELVINGGFDADSGWTKEDATEWTISDGKAHFTPTVFVDGKLFHLIDEGAPFTKFVSGRRYHISVDASNVNLSGTDYAKVTFDNEDCITITEEKTYSADVVFNDTSGAIEINGHSETVGHGFSVDNVSVCEVLADGGMSGAEYLSILDEER